MSALRTLSNRLVGRLPAALWLLLVWLAVSGSYTTASFVGGVIAVVALMILFPDREFSEAQHRARPLMLLRYVAYFGRELAVANIHVARAVLSPHRVDETRSIVEIPLPASSRLVEAILANAVSLTPGTSIIEVGEDPPVLYVHVLEMQSVDQVRSSIAELHWRIVRAIGPADRLDEVRTFADDLRVRVDRGAGTS